MPLFKKTPQQIDIPNPCHESWANMTPAKKGKFCAACQKCVVDFTLMNNIEIKNYLNTHQGKICGRIGSKQLEQVNQLMNQPAPSNWHKWKLAAATLTGLTISTPSIGQNIKNITSNPKGQLEWTEFFHAPDQQEETEQKLEEEEKTVEIEKRVIHGIILDKETQEPILGVSVIIKDSNPVWGTVSDYDGTFELDIDDKEWEEKESITLQFSYIGYDVIDYKQSLIDQQMNIGKIFLTENHILLGDVCISHTPKRNIFSRTWHGIKNLFRKKH